MDLCWHIAGHYNIAAEMLLNQVRVQGVRCMWSLVSRTWEAKHTNIQSVKTATVLSIVYIVNMHGFCILTRSF